MEFWGECGGVDVLRRVSTRERAVVVGGYGGFRDEGFGGFYCCFRGV